MPKDPIIDIDEMLTTLKSLLPDGKASIGEVRRAFENTIRSEGAPTTFEVFERTMAGDEELILALDNANCIIFSSKGVQTLFGLDEKALIGKQLTHWLNDTDSEQVTQHLAEYRHAYSDDAQNTAQRHQAVVFHIKGYKIHLHLTLVPAGKHVGIVLHNVGDREILEAVVDHLPCGISVVDKELRLVAYNEELIRLQNFSRHLFVDRSPTYAELVHDICERGDYGDVNTEEKVIEMVALAKQFQPHRFSRERSDGTVLDICGAPIPGGGFVTTYMDITDKHRQDLEIETLVAELERAALHDQLTGLANRIKLLQAFDYALARQRRYGNDLSLLVIDLDHFKRVNDTYGHVVGDIVLTAMADVLSKGVRDTDLAARFGGEEFAILLPETDQSGAVELAEKLRTTMAEYPVLVPHLDNAITMTGSFGTATMKTGDSKPFVEFFNFADQGVYAAKADGRNCVRTIAKLK